MMWKQEENSSLLTFESSATTSNALQSDLELVFDRLNKERIIENKEILLFIDATNGVVIISGYDHQSSESLDDNKIWIWLQNFWEENSNAYDFDDIVMTTLIKTMRTNVGAQTKKLFKVYLQTELEDARELK